MISLYTMSLFDGFVDSKNYIAYLLSLFERKILLSYCRILPLQFPNDIYYYFLTYQSSRWLRDKMQGHKWSSTDKGILEELWAYIYYVLIFTRKWIWERKILLSYSRILPLQFPNDIYYYFLTYQSSRWLRDKMQGHKWSSTDKGILEELWAYIYYVLIFTRKWIWERKILLSYSRILPLQFPNDIYYYFLTYQSSRWLRDKMEGHKWSRTDNGIL